MSCWAGWPACHRIHLTDEAASRMQSDPPVQQHCILSKVTLLAFCCVHLKLFASTNPDVTLRLDGRMSTLTTSGYTIYKHADVDY